MSDGQGKGKNKSGLNPLSTTASSLIAMASYIQPGKRIMHKSSTSVSIGRAPKLPDPSYQPRKVQYLGKNLQSLNLNVYSPGPAAYTTARPFGNPVAGASFAGTRSLRPVYDANGEWANPVYQTEMRAREAERAQRRAEEDEEDRKEFEEYLAAAAAAGAGAGAMSSRTQSSDGRNASTSSSSSSSSSSTSSSSSSSSSEDPSLRSTMKAQTTSASPTEDQDDAAAAAAAAAAASGTSQARPVQGTPAAQAVG